MSCFVEQGLVVQKGIKTWAKSKSKLPVSYQMLVFTLLNEALNTKKKHTEKAVEIFLAVNHFFIVLLNFLENKAR